VLERIGTLTYRLELPPGVRIHDLFHVGLLKAYRGDLPAVPPALPPTVDGRLLPGPGKVLKAQQRHGVWHVLVQWTGLSVEDTTWEKLNEFRQQFSDIQLEDELFAQAGRDVMTDLHYSRKRPTSGSV
jgi:hypothetical protein